MSALWFYSAVVSCVFAILAALAPAVAQTMVIAFVALLLVPAIIVERAKRRRRRRRP